MHSILRRPLQAWLLAAAAAALTSGCAGPGGAAPASSGAPLQQADQLLRQATPNMPLSVRVRPDQVTTGSPVAVDVATPNPGYLYVFQISTDGKTLEPIFPNAVDGANFINGGIANLPRPNWRMTTKGPAGIGYIVAVIASKPQDLIALAAQARQSRFAIDGPYGAAMAPLREVAP